ncbi:MAG: formimidoylglutamate deiminase, partial [Acidobacteriota bacterium]|nr:formimidoylglutamate deiminase [Acidobacteriota bacterium]
GRRAMGHGEARYFPVGGPFDAVIFNGARPLLDQCAAERKLAAIIYASDPSTILGTMIGGEWVTERGRHRDYDPIAQEFAEALKRLGNRR